MDLSEYTWVASTWVQEKIKERGITVSEIEEAVCNSEPPYRIEVRAQHKTTPPTRWFIAPTFEDRLLKVYFMLVEEEKLAIIKTAFEPAESEIQEYESYKVTK